MIIVTGGCGLIGTHILMELNRLGFERDIIVVDDFKKSTKWKNLRQKKYGEFVSRFELFDWLDEQEEEVRAIIHMGANSATTGIDGDEYYDLNYRYTLDLANYALGVGARFIYASSAATYGDGSNGFSDDIDQLDVLKPLNLYGQSKQMVDQWMVSNGYLDDVVGLKFFNVYGPNEYHKGRMASVVFHAFNQIKTNHKMNLFKSHRPDFEDGHQSRDFVYVKDVVDVLYYFFIACMPNLN